MSYELIKTLHLIAVISWMAGLLYLPRLFVNHVAVAPGGDNENEVASTLLKTMERRLLHIIMNPAMLATWGFGFWLMTITVSYADGWFHLKLLLVILMSGAHISFGIFYKRFENDENRHSARFFRILNEVPTLLMVAIIILVVFKPF